jgi:hypothetical protein
LGFVFVWGGWLVAQSLNLIGEKSIQNQEMDVYE